MAVNCTHVDKFNEYNERELRHFRRIAFIAVMLGTVSTFSCVILMPISHQYVQRIQSTLASELDFCESRNRNSWHEILNARLGRYEFRRVVREEIAKSTGIESLNQRLRIPPQSGNEPKFYIRNRRQGELEYDKFYGQEQTGATSNYEPDDISKDNRDISYYIKDGSDISNRKYCSCKMGPPGPPGYPGLDGKNGRDGKPGGNGIPGKDASHTKVGTECIRRCIPGPMGLPGHPGDKGPRGYPGERGDPGFPGKPGKKGSPGKLGVAGPIGPPGKPGSMGISGKRVQGIAAPGLPGRIGMVGSPGQSGAPGKKGRQGERGPCGIRGMDGNPGRFGENGIPGFPGLNGSPGLKGSCDQCQNTKLPPGY